MNEYVYLSGTRLMGSDLGPKWIDDVPAPPLQLSSNFDNLIISKVKWSLIKVCRFIFRGSHMHLCSIFSRIDFNHHSFLFTIKLSQMLSPNFLSVNPAANFGRSCQTSIAFYIQGPAVSRLLLLFKTILDFLCFSR